MIIGITGTNGAGKGAVVDYLVTEKGFVHYSGRAHLTKILKERGLPVDRPHLGQLGNELRASYGAGYLVEQFTKAQQQNNQEDIVIESIRSLGEVAALKEKGGVLIAVTADERTRYERIVARASDTDQVDFEQFVKEEQNEWAGTADSEMNVPKVIEAADYILENNGILPELHAQISEVLSALTE